MQACTQEEKKETAEPQPCLEARCCGLAQGETTHCLPGVCACAARRSRGGERSPLSPTDRPNHHRPFRLHNGRCCVSVCMLASVGVCRLQKKNVAVVCALFYKTIRKKEKMQSEVSLAAVSSARARARATKDGLTFEACSLSSLSRALSGRSSSSAIKCIIFFPQNKIKKKKASSSSYRVCFAPRALTSMCRL